jgi:hypothetical protein
MRELGFLFVTTTYGVQSFARLATTDEETLLRPSQHVDVGVDIGTCPRLSSELLNWCRYGQKILSEKGASVGGP